MTSENGERFRGFVHRMSRRNSIVSSVLKQRVLQRVRGLRTKWVSHVDATFPRIRETSGSTRGQALCPAAPDTSASVRIPVPPVTQVNIFLTQTTNAARVPRERVRQRRPRRALPAPRHTTRQLLHNRLVLRVAQENMTPQRRQHRPRRRA